jgi:hypothetical protein
MTDNTNTISADSSETFLICESFVGLPIYYFALFGIIAGSHETTTWMMDGFVRALPNRPMSTTCRHPPRLFRSL